MANGNIRGITIELNGDTTGLEQALADVNRESKDLQKELKEVERALKFDPGNTELVRQRQELLTQSIQQTSQKLDTLRQAQAQVQAQFDRGEIGADQYRAFQRELVNTENQLSRFESQLNGIQGEQDRLAQNTRDLNTFFQATGTTVDDFSARLGTRLTNAIRDGSASADQLERALNQIGRASLGAGQDLDEFRNSLRNADNGAPIDEIRQDLDRLRQEADRTTDSVDKMGSKMEAIGDGANAVAAGVAALGAAAGLSAAQFDNAIGQIQAGLGVTREEAEALEEAAKNVWKAGFGESLEDVSAALIRVKQNIKGIDDGEVEIITKNALSLAKAFDSDVNEVTRGARGLMTGFGIDAKTAFDSMAKGAQSGLNFSNDLFDQMAEFGPLWGGMGFSIEEMFGKLVFGAESGAYQLDYLNDIMKEYEVKTSMMDKSTVDAFASMSKAAQDTYDSFLKGEITLAQLNQVVSKELGEMDDKTAAFRLGVDILGTKFEDLGQETAMAFLSSQNAMSDFEGAMNSVAEVQEQTFGQRWAAFTRTAATSLEPLGKILLDLAERWLPKIISVVENLATWFSNLSPVMQSVTVGIGLIAAAIGPLIMVFSSVASAISTIVGLMGGFGAIASAISTAFTVMTGPIGIAVAAIVAAGTLIYANWEAISTWLTTAWDAIKTTAVTVFNELKDSVGAIWEQISSAISTAWTAISDFFSTIWSGIKEIFNTVIEEIKSLVDGYWTSMKDGVTTVWDGIKQYFSSVWDLIKNVFVGALLVVMQLLTGQWKEAMLSTKQIWENIKEALSGMWEGIKKVFSGALSAVVGFVKTHWENIKNTTSTVFNAVKIGISTAWNAIKTTVSTIAESIWTTIKSKFTSIATSVSEKMTEVKTSITNLWGEAQKFLEGIDLTEIGKDIIRGLISGIKAMTKKAVEAITGVVDGVINKAKSLLDINSPSGVFMQFGEWTNEGFIEGINDSSKRLQNAVGNVYGSLASSADKSNANQIAQTQIIQQGANIDLNSLVAAITQLAGRPVQTTVNMDGREIANSVSVHQFGDANLKGFRNGVPL